MFTGFFTGRDVVDYASAVSSDRRLYALFFKAMLDEGIFFAPSQYEAAFLTMAHDDEVVEQTIEACRRVFRKIKNLESVRRPLRPSLVREDAEEHPFS